MRSTFSRASRLSADVARGARRRRCRPFAGAGACCTDTRAGEHDAAARVLRAATASRATADRAAGAATTERTAAASDVAGRIDPRRAALLFRLRDQEALIMAHHRGRSVATINHPIERRSSNDHTSGRIRSRVELLPRD